MAVQYRAIGKRIRELRRERKITQQKMAELIGVSDIHYGRLERGERSMSLEQLEHMACALGVRVQDLLEGAFPDEVLRSVHDADESSHLHGVTVLMQGMDTKKQRLVFDLCYVIAAEERY